MFQLGNILLSALGSAILVFILLFFWKLSKDRFRFAILSLSSFLCFTAWNLLQNATGADSLLNIDWPVFPMTWSDVGSGVVAFVATVIALGLLTDRNETAWRVVVAADRRIALYTHRPLLSLTAQKIVLLAKLLGLLSRPNLKKAIFFRSSVSS